MQQALIELPPPEPRHIECDGVDNPVAQVILDVPIYHLDQPFDYLIPAHLAQRAHVGMRVKIPLGRNVYEGWIIQRSSTTTHQGKLAPLRSVIGQIPPLTRSLYELACHLAQRNITTVSDVLTAAIPARHARSEQQLLDEIGLFSPPGLTRLPDADTPLTQMFSTLPSFAQLPAVDMTVLQGYGGGQEFLRSIQEGKNPRALCDVVPDPLKGGRGPFNIFAEGVLAALASQRKALLIVPTHDHAIELAKTIQRRIPGQTVTLLSSNLEPGPRYRSYLQCLLGRTRIAVGTVSAAMVPMNRLGFIGLYDDGDERLRMRRSPFLHARHIVTERAHREQAALLCAGYTRSLYTHFLYSSGWITALKAQRRLIAKSAPTVQVLDPMDDPSDGKAAFARFPPRAHSILSNGLETGPVVVLVPHTGYVPVVGCMSCGACGRCPQCGGRIELLGSGGFRCFVCGYKRQRYQCYQCQGTRLKAYRIGSERTGEELGRMFPGVPITVSSSRSVVVEHVGTKPRIVISTPFATPYTDEGYSAGVIVDAQSWLRRNDLDAAEQTMRAWQLLGTYLRGQAPLAIVGWPGAHVAQAMQRWDSALLCQELLKEHHELHLPPAYFTARLTGQRHDVSAILHSSELPQHTERLGPVACEGKPEVYQGVVRIEHRYAQELAKVLHQIQNRRSLHRLRPVKVYVDPLRL
ncbi:MAG: hypothetical protein Q4P66_06830 [Actinomycetaceae bacterium]|nr:hypothetical protein [Actinomycetaceae bacterium]